MEIITPADIIDYIRSRGYTVTDIARECGVSISAVSRVACGKSIPRRPLFDALRALGVRLAEEAKGDAILVEAIGGKE